MVNFAIKSDHWFWQVLQLFGWGGSGSVGEAWSIFLIGLLIGSFVTALSIFIVRFFGQWRKQHLSLLEKRDPLLGTLVPSSLDQEVIDLLNLRRRRRQRRIRDRRAFL